MSTVVVGGGISGLVIAHELVKRGEDVQLLEASPRIGGTIRTFHQEGFFTEAGPNGFLDNEPATLELVEELGLTPRLRRAEPTVKRRFVFSRGALHELPSNPAAFFGSQILSLGSKLRLLAEPFTRRPATDGDESLASFARRHLGAGAADTLVDAMQSGIFAGDPEQLSVAAVFPRLVELEKKHRSLVWGMVRARKAAKDSDHRAKTSGGALCTFDQGLEVLPRALGERLGDRVRTGVTVEQLRPDQEGWGLQTSVGPVQARRLVLALPSYAAAELMRPLDPTLADELDQILYSPVSVVHLGFRSDELPRSMGGFGFLVPERERRRVMGAIFVSSIFPWRVEKDGTLLTVMVGGARHPELAALSEAQLVELVREELTVVMGLRDEPHFTQVVRWPRAIPQYNVGHLARIARLQERLLTLPRLFLTGNAYRGIGVNDCVRTGLTMAERVLASG
ncbi:MAG: protoporphyrinogen oxidase [Myxococcota bacterium]|nr:protoporphyrinogen oxidase [Myxococcota bacterium]